MVFLWAHYSAESGGSSMELVGSAAGKSALQGGTFDRAAARAALLYVASGVSGPTFHKVSKVFYFADRLHLERYGSFMFGDEYWALRFGPVPMNAYRDMDQVRQHPELSCEAGFSVETVKVDGWPAPVIRPLCAPDLDELSAATLQCLDESMARHGGQSFGELTDLSHDAAWNGISQDEVMSVELIASTLPNARAVLEYLSDPYP